MSTVPASSPLSVSHADETSSAVASNVIAFPVRATDPAPLKVEDLTYHQAEAIFYGLALPWPSARSEQVAAVERSIPLIEAEISRIGFEVLRSVAADLTAADRAGHWWVRENLMPSRERRQAARWWTQAFCEYLLVRMGALEPRSAYMRAVAA